MRVYIYVSVVTEYVSVYMCVYRLHMQNYRKAHQPSIFTSAPVVNSFIILRSFPACRTALQRRRSSTVYILAVSLASLDYFPWLIESFCDVRFSMVMDVLIHAMDSVWIH